jgi:hypothetical protein
MLIYNIGFINEDNKDDETQLDIEEPNYADEVIVELMNLILDLKDEMGIKKITYIECVGREEEDE